MSARETALSALDTALQTIVGPTVERNAEVPKKIPADGLLILHDGDAGEPDVVMSPTTYEYEHRAELDCVVQKGTPAARDTAFDTLMALVSTAINADTTLGDAVQLVRYEAPDMEQLGDLEGADDLKAATVPIILYYSTTDPLD